MKFNNTISQIRKSFIDFFVKNGHISYSSSSLIPKNDPSLMFTNAGMVPFKELFLSEDDSQEVENIVSSQKCLRVGGKHNDLENVGHTNRHHTFFEMLGNFSFGRYFKENAIELAWKFITKELQLNPNRLYITVYHNDNQSYDIWKKITSFPDHKIIKINTEDNFWSMGTTGPCGPCSEIFYDYGEKIAGGLPGTKDSDGPRFTEIWNLVFMQYHRTSDGTLQTLRKQCIDTGMGLERISSVMQNVYDNYEIDLFKDLIIESQDISHNTTNILAHRIIADHTRAAAFLISEGILPGNEGRNYVLRRIIRRASRYVYQLNYEEPLLNKIFLKLLDEKCCSYMADCYPELLRAKDLIFSTLSLEEENFKMTLFNGLTIINKELASLNEGDSLSGELAFKLYDTYGFPLDITLDIARERNLVFNIQSFNKKMDEQKKLSRKNWIGSGAQEVDKIYLNILAQYGKTKFVGYNIYDYESEILFIVSKNKTIVKHAEANEEIEIIMNATPFYAESGGQKGDIGIIKVVGNFKDSDTIIEVIDTSKINGLHIHKCLVKSGRINVGDIVSSRINVQYRKSLQANHSATHILHHVLRTCLGNHVVQKGSLITENKLRFDFTSNKQLNSKEVREIETKVNEMIWQNHLVSCEMEKLENALSKGVTALFGEKYEDEVRIISIDQSKELCGGTHVSYSSEIGMFKIISESSIAFGIRRIEAITGKKALEYTHNNEITLQEISRCLKAPQSGIIDALQIIIKENKNFKSKLESLYQNIIELYKINTVPVHDISLHHCSFQNIPINVIRSFTIKTLRNIKTITIFNTILNNDLIYIIGVSKDLHDQITSSYITSEVEKVSNCKGGGNIEISQLTVNKKTPIKIIEESMKIISKKISKN